MTHLSDRSNRCLLDRWTWNGKAIENSIGLHESLSNLRYKGKSIELERNQSELERVVMDNWKVKTRMGFGCWTKKMLSRHGLSNLQVLIQEKLSWTLFKKSRHVREAHLGVLLGLDIDAPEGPHVRSKSYSNMTMILKLRLIFLPLYNHFHSLLSNLSKSRNFRFERLKCNPTHSAERSTAAEQFLIIVINCT